VWPTYLFVAGSIILLQCLSIIHKTGTNLRNDEIWRLLLLVQIPTLVNLVTRTLGRIIEKEISLPEICCRNVQFDIKFQDITHTCCSIVFLPDPWTKQYVKKALLSISFGKCPLNFMFLVSPNDKRFYSYLGTSVGLSQTKILFTSYNRNIPFRNTVLSQKFEALIFHLLISC